MNCPDCESPTKVTRTAHVLGVTVRTIGCACGARFESLEKVVKRLHPDGRSSAYVHMGGYISPPVSTGEQGWLPVDANALGGLGGPIRSALVVPSRSDPDPNPSLLDPPNRGRALSNSASAAPTDFNAFWSLYPRHVAKAAALRSWIKINPGSDLIQLILTSIRWQREIFLARDSEKRPHPATWLNQRRWEDERPAPAVEQRPAPTIGYAHATNKPRITGDVTP